MKKLALAVMAATFCLFGAQIAAAASVVDQSDTNFYGGYGGFQQVGESFTAGLTGQLTSIDLYSNSGAYNAGNAVVSLYAGDGIGVTPLASGSFAAIVGANSFSFDLSSLNFSVIAGQQYTFNVDAGSYRYYGSLDFNNGGTYAGGQLYLNNSLFNGADLTFATHVDTDAAAVPEPASWAMMVGGFGLLGASLRRRKPVVTFA